MNYLINKGINTNMSKKDKIQLAVIWGLAFVLYLGLYIWFQIYTSTPASAASLDQPSTSFVHVDTCPPGSYSIGIEKDGVHICKLEPTGCPFGDSVPLDKCAPPPDIICNLDWSHCEPRTTPPVIETPPNDTSTTPATQTPANTLKSTNNVKSEPNVDASYAAPDANDTTEDNETAAITTNANDDKPDAPLFAGIATNKSQTDNVPVIVGTSVAYGLLSLGAFLAPSSWYSWIGALIRKPFGK